MQGGGESRHQEAAAVRTHMTRQQQLQRDVSASAWTILVGNAAAKGTSDASTPNNIKYKYPRGSWRTQAFQSFKKQQRKVQLIGRIQQQRCAESTVFCALCSCGFACAADLSRHLKLSVCSKKGATRSALRTPRKRKKQGHRKADCSSTRSGNTSSSDYQPLEMDPDKCPSSAVTAIGAGTPDAKAAAAVACNDRDHTESMGLAKEAVASAAEAAQTSAIGEATRQAAQRKEEDNCSKISPPVVMATVIREIELPRTGLPCPFCPERFHSERRRDVHVCQNLGRSVQMAAIVSDDVADETCRKAAIRCVGCHASFLMVKDYADHQQYFCPCLRVPGAAKSTSRVVKPAVSHGVVPAAVLKMGDQNVPQEGATDSVRAKHVHGREGEKESPQAKRRTSRRLAVINL